MASEATDGGRNPRVSDEEILDVLREHELAVAWHAAPYGLMREKPAFGGKLWAGRL